jgi:hypothetical protein
MADDIFDRVARLERKVDCLVRGMKIVGGNRSWPNVSGSVPPNDAGVRRESKGHLEKFQRC